MFDSATQTTFAVPHQPEYEHTQWAPMCWLILLPGLSVLLIGAMLSGDPDVVVPFIIAGAVLTAAAFSFRSLRVVDEGDQLAIRFGPIPVFRRRVAYANIVAAEPDRSNVIDGWGIRWVPGRGWTYNLWGFDCVRLTLANGRTIRVGTDDPRSLAQFVQTRIAQE
jgi:hypothetical protein